MKYRLKESEVEIILFTAESAIDCLRFMSNITTCDKHIYITPHSKELILEIKENNFDITRVREGYYIIKCNEKLCFLDKEAFEKLFTKLDEDEKDDV